MVSYKFTCTCGKFEAVDADRAKVLEAAKKHAETCSDLQGADEIAIQAMTETVE